MSALARAPLGIASSAGLVLLLAGSAAGLPQTADYDELTNTYRSVTNFNVETVRGIALAPSGNIFMINTHGSTLDAFLPGGPIEIDFYWPTINNPIALGIYVDPGAEPPDGEYGLVLGGGTHALAMHDLLTGRIVRTLNLPAETGDLVIDQENERAFVSLPGNDTVVQIALPKLVVEATFEVQANRPRFLFLDTGDPEDAADNVVLVAPELSGNNSIPIGGTVVFAFSLAPFLPEGLPDEDLFRITPVTIPTEVVQPTDAMLRNAGTLLMEHGRNPVTGEYWMVGVDARNTSAITEPDIKGTFATNLLTIAPALWDGLGAVPFSHTRIDLDLVGTSYDEKFSVSFPYALAFHPGGAAAIAGAASDQIRGIDQAGDRIGDLELPVGSIPRDVVFDAAGLLMFVYCWGTNEVLVYDVTAVVNAMAADPDLIAEEQEGLIATFDLGADPTQERIKHGRAIFYDGDNSLNGRTTCNHCHPGGGMDLIGWNIQDFPHDHKDLMVTQSLKSIEDTFPYHWRGERDLEAFNVAFAGLLGGTELGEEEGGELADFKAFVFSLQAHANPRQNPNRVLDPAKATVLSSFDPPPGHQAGDPVAGQVAMDVPDTLFQRFSCADCHGKVAGTVGDPQNDDVGPIPGNLNLDVAHFRQLFHKNQDVVDVTITLGGEPTEFQFVRGGFGISHDGNHPSVFDFLQIGAFDITEEQRRDLAAFVEQADQGISPACHRAYKVDRSTEDRVIEEIDKVLLGQAGLTFTEDHWVSVAVIGTHEDASGVAHDLRWYFLPASDRFFAHDPGVVFPNGLVGSQSWQDLLDEVDAGRAEFTILGMPPANAFRFSVDRDDDGLLDVDEAPNGTHEFDPDFDDDGDPDGHEVAHGMTQLDPDLQADDQVAPSLTSGRIDHMGATYGKLVLVFSEPVTLNITATNTVTGHSTVEQRFVPRVFDSITVQRLQPSLPMIDYPPTFPIGDVAGVPFPYSLDLEMIDLSGNSTSITVGGVAVPRDQLVLNPFFLTEVGGVPDIPPAFLSRTVEDLAWVGDPAGGPSFQATAEVQHRFAVPEVDAAYASPPNTPNGSAGPKEKQVIVAQVLHRDSATGDWTVLQQSEGDITVSAPPDMLHDELLLQADPPEGDPEPEPTAFGLPGPFLLSTTSGVDGVVTFDFTLSEAVPAGDSVKLNVLAILEQDSRDESVLPNEFWSGSLLFYNKPATAESDRGIEYPEND